MTVRNSDERPLVSVIIPTFNRAHTLMRSLGSVLAQNYPHIQAIVVDDASRDNTIKLLSKINDPRVKVIRHDHNRGASAARNTGIGSATGEFIAFQDSDDEWLQGKLSKQMDTLLSSDPSYVGVYCTKIVYGRDSNYIRGKRRVVCVPGPDEEALAGDIRPHIWHRNVISTQTLVCRRCAALSVGGFDELLHSSEEWDLVMRMAEHGYFAFVDEPLVSTYIQSDSISRLSQRSLYSQIRIVNKMKRRGIANTVLSEHYSRLGAGLARIGRVRLGRRLMWTSLQLKPFKFKPLARYGRDRLEYFRSRSRGRS